jgi:hypothetical protein
VQIFKARFAALAGASILWFAGGVQAAGVALDDPATVAAPASFFSVHPAAAASGPKTGHLQLMMDPLRADPRLVGFAMEPASTAGSLARYADIDAFHTASETARQLAGRNHPTAAATETPLHAYLLGAGQFVLEVGTFSSEQPVSVMISAAPLPGAAWLFGSGLVAFLWIAARRRL